MLQQYMSKMLMLRKDMSGMLMLRQQEAVMKHTWLVIGICLSLLTATAAMAVEKKQKAPAKKKLEIGPNGEYPEAALADENHKWGVHNMHRPQPKVVRPGAAGGMPPRDAIVLFNGEDQDEWLADKFGGHSKWVIKDGALESVKKAGYIRTRRSFGDCQLHVEFATPKDVQGDSQGRGNSGVFLMGKYEIQVLDSYQNLTYADGSAGSVYGQSPPLVNASRLPGEWQTYDIIFRAPVFEDKKLVKPGTITVLHNGVLIQDHWTIEGGTYHKRRSSYAPHAPKLPLKLQDHGNPVRYRNIWVRELPPLENIKPEPKK